MGIVTVKIDPEIDRWAWFECTVCGYSWGTDPDEPAVCMKCEVQKVQDSMTEEAKRSLYLGRLLEDRCVRCGSDSPHPLPYCAACRMVLDLPYRFRVPEAIQLVLPGFDDIIESVLSP